MAAIIKADKKDIPKIVETLAGSHGVGFVGWAVAAVILVGAIAFIKLSSRIHDREIERLVNERNLLQQKLLGVGGEE